MSTPKIELLRSDLGCGGWSLHAKVGDASLLLLSGEARLRKGEWTRPSARDYARARKLALKILGAEEGEVA